MHDTHCHVDMFDSPQDLVIEIESSEVPTVAVTSLPSHYPQAVRHLKGVRYVEPSLGFHPLYVRENEHELKIFERYAGRANFIGEIGIDASQIGKESLEAQTVVFERIVDFISDRPRCVTIHSRGAERQILEILEQQNMYPVVFHWYSGGIRVLNDIVDSGHYFSINSRMMRSKSFLKMLSCIPRSHVLMESDGPFIKNGGIPDTPTNQQPVMDCLSKEWGLPMAQVSDILAINFKRYCSPASVDWF